MTELIDDHSTSTTKRTRRKVVLPDVDTSHTGTLLPLHVKPKRTERVLLTFTLSEYERLMHAADVSGMGRAVYIRRTLFHGLDRLPELLRECQGEVDGALHLAVLYDIENWTATDIGKERHREQQGEGKEEPKPGRRPRNPASHEERGFKRYTLRLTEKECARIASTAQELGLTTGGLIWRLLMGYPLFSLNLAAYEAWDKVEETAYSIKALLILANKKSTK